MATGGANTIKERLDAIDAGAGLVQGALPIWSNANYVASANSLRSAISVLDSVMATMLTSHNGILGTDLDASGHTIKNLPLPQADGDAASRKYVDQRVGNTQVNLDAVFEELNAVEVASGLDANGNFPPVTYSFHLNGIANLRQGLLQLDSAVGNTYLRRDGGSLTGAVYNSVPIANDYQLVNKKYVDDKYAQVSNTEHNALHGLQGGQSYNSEYYHLSYSEVLRLGSLTNVHSQLSGLSGGDYATGFWHLTADEHSVTQSMVTQWKNNGNNFGVVGSAIAHNALASIQGGNGTDEFYHLTAYNHTRLTSMVNQWDANGQNFIGVAGSHNGLTGLQGGAPSSYYHLDYSQYSTLGSMLSMWYTNGNKFVDGASIDHNTLSNIQGGQVGERYHFNLNQHQTLLDVAAEWTANGGSFVTNNNMGTVVITNPQNGHVLTYDGTKWVNQAPAVASTSFAALSDVQLTSLTTNQVPQWNGSKWVNVTLPYSTLLSGLNDTQISGQTAGQLLKWNGTRWINADLPQASDTVLGGIKIGSGLTIDGLGVVSVSGGGGGGGATTLNDLTDTTVVDPVAAQMLVYDGSQWSNAAFRNAVAVGSLASDPYWTNVRILLQGNEGLGATTPVNKSSYPVTCAFVGSHWSVDTTVKKYGSGSYWFQGDYTSLTGLQTNVAMSMGTGDFTAESWFNYESYVAWWPTIFACRSTDNTQPMLQVSVDYSTRNLVLYTKPLNGSLVTNVIPSTTISQNTWYHVAVSRASGTIRVFLNGVLVFSVADSTDFTSGTAIWQLSNLGSGGWWNGWIDDFRFTENVARYTSSFTPPASELYAGQASEVGLNVSGLLDVQLTSLATNDVLKWNGTKWVNGVGGGGASSLSALTDVMINSPAVDQLLGYNGVQWTQFSVQGLTRLDRSMSVLNFEGTAGSTTVTDDSAAARVWSVAGNAQLSATRSKFGSTSLYLDGSGDWIQTTTRLSEFAFGDDFTLAGWFYIVSNNVAVFDAYQTSAGWQLFLNGSGNLAWYKNGALTLTGSGTVSLSAWNHIAVCKSGTTLRLFLNGTLIGSVSDATGYTMTGVTAVAIGAQVSTGPNYALTGYVDSVIITQQALYTTSFTVPTAAYTAATSGLLTYGMNLATLLDVGVSGPTSGQVLQFDGTQWVNATPASGGGSSTIAGMTDVTLVNQAPADVLIWNGTTWANTPIIGASYGSNADASFNSVTLLVNFETGSVPQDISTKAYAVTNSSVTMNSATVRVGSRSGYFNGSASLSTNCPLDFGTGDFTLDGWVYMTSVSGVQRIISAQNNSYNGLILLRVNAGKMEALTRNQSAVLNTITSTTTLTTAQWYHFEFSRTGGYIRLFLNGTLEASAADTADLGTQILTQFNIGSYLGGGEFFNGYIDEVRVTKGVARHTASFTAPTDPMGTALVNGLQVSMSSLSDVKVTSPSYGQALVWDGTKWANGTATAVSSFRVTSPAYAATMALDWSGSDEMQITLTGNLTLSSMIGALNGQRMMLKLKQDSTGGRTLTITGTNIRKPSSLSVLNLTPTPGAVDRIGLVYDATDSKYDIVAFAADLR